MWKLFEYPIGNRQMEDEPGLIHSKRAPKQGTVREFLLLKAGTFLVFLFCAGLEMWPCPALIFIGCTAFAEFWGIKNKEGLELVGMRWSHEITELETPTWVFYSRRDPYVPDAAASRVFWSGTFISCIVWFLTFFASMLKWSWFWTVICGLILAAEIVNALCFKNCDGVSVQQIEDVARTVMLGDAFASSDLESEPEINTEADPEKPHEEEEQVEQPRLILPKHPGKQEVDETEE